MKPSNRGFSMIELLVVLAILGAISAVAVPTLMGSRRSAATKGDAMATAAALRMILESAKSDTGSYGPAGTYTWTAGTTNPASSTLASRYPAFQPGASRMNYTVTIPNPGGAANLSYLLTVNDNSRPGKPMVYQTDDTGTTLFTLK